MESFVYDLLNSSFRSRFLFCASPSVVFAIVIIMIVKNSDLATSICTWYTSGHCWRLSAHSTVDPQGQVEERWTVTAREPGEDRPEPAGRTEESRQRHTAHLIG